jgi:hypothetical protein
MVLAHARPARKRRKGLEPVATASLSRPWKKGQWIGYKEWLTRQAVADRTLSPSALKAYLFILRHINNRTLEWTLCKKSIAAGIGRSVRQTQRALGEPERRGYIGRTPRRGGANIYRIPVPSKAVLASLVASSDDRLAPKAPSQSKVRFSGIGYGRHGCLPRRAVTGDMDVSPQRHGCLPLGLCHPLPCHRKFNRNP